MVLTQFLLPIVVIVLLIELIFTPRIDTAINTLTNEEWYVLWYGKTNRKYIRLFAKIK
jgi:hypothetical protein